jgi:DnaJ-class molecular chaperone
MNMKRCPKCKGTGTVMRHYRQGKSWSLKPGATRCEKCWGTGKVESAPKARKE